MITQPYFAGPPEFNVGLKPIALEHWLLPDDQATWIGPKNQLMNTRRDEVFAALGGSYGAQSEVADMISALGLGPFRSTEPPLLAASRLISDDLVVMEMHEGAWTTTACCLCNPTFFSAHQAVGKSLSLLHGPVPDGDFKLSNRIGRIFSLLTPDTILERHNWTVQWSDARFTPNGAPLRDMAAKAGTELAAENLYLRVERQTIRALSKSSAIVFTIRVRLTNLAKLLDDPSHREAFAHAWISTPEPVRGYKRWEVLERHIAAVLKIKNW